MISKRRTLSFQVFSKLICRFNTVSYKKSSSERLKSSLEVIYSDNHIIVVNKPPGILSQNDINNNASIIDDVKDYIRETKSKPGNVYVGTVHRLDRNTSGVMVFATTSKAAARISEEIRKRDIDKKYVCVVMGELRGKEILNQNMMEYYTYDKAQKKNVANKMKVLDSKEVPLPKGVVNAKLSYESLLVFPSRKDPSKMMSLVKVVLVTGRKHQIRAQLASIGHPIAGDRKYGAPSAFRTEDICLHSYSLTINHPITQQSMTFASRVPDSWAQRFGFKVVERADELISDITRSGVEKNE